MLFMNGKYVLNIFMATFVTQLMMSECRVLCRDINALQWNQTGVTCPISCANVRAAIDRLQRLDRQQRDSLQNRILMIKSHKQILHGKVNKEKLSFHKRKKQKLMKKYDQKMHLYLKKAFDLKDVHTMVNSLNAMVAETYLQNETCLEVLKSYAKKPTALLKTMIQHCTKRANTGDLIAKITKILNMHSGGRFKFNDNITMILLKKILGENMNLRQGIFDVQRVVTYIQRDALAHETHTRVEPVLHISTQRCVNINVPGCYCQEKFVEDSGQCVHPASCVSSMEQAVYLRRLRFDWGPNATSTATAPDVGVAKPHIH